jgi:hypothetical protein
LSAWPRRRRGRRRRRRRRRRRAAAAAGRRRRRRPRPRTPLEAMDAADDAITLPLSNLPPEAAVSLAGVLSDAAVDRALSDGGYRSWLYLNPANTEACQQLEAKVVAAGRAWAVVEVDKDALTLEVAEEAVAG